MLVARLLGEDRFIGGGAYPTIADIAIVTALRRPHGLSSSGPLPP